MTYSNARELLRWLVRGVLIYQGEELWLDIHDVLLYQGGEILVVGHPWGPDLPGLGSDECYGGVVVGPRKLLRT